MANSHARRWLGEMQLWWRGPLPQPMETDAEPLSRLERALGLRRLSTTHNTCSKEDQGALSKTKRKEDQGYQRNLLHPNTR